MATNIEAEHWLSLCTYIYSQLRDMVLLLLLWHHETTTKKKIH